MNLSKKKKKRKHKMGEGGFKWSPKTPLGSAHASGCTRNYVTVSIELVSRNSVDFFIKNWLPTFGKKKMRFLLIRWFEFYLYNRAAIFAIHANYGIWVLLFRVKLTNLKWGIWSNLGKLQLKVKPHTRNVVSKVMVVTDLKLIKGLSVKLKQYLQENIYLG